MIGWLQISFLLLPITGLIRPSIPRSSDSSATYWGIIFDINLQHYLIYWVELFKLLDSHFTWDMNFVKNYIFSQLIIFHILPMFSYHSGVMLFFLWIILWWYRSSIQCVSFPENSRMPHCYWPCKYTTFDMIFAGSIKSL